MAFAVGWRWPVWEPAPHPQLLGGNANRAAVAVVSGWPRVGAGRPRLISRRRRGREWRSPSGGGGRCGNRRRTLNYWAAMRTGRRWPSSRGGLAWEPAGRALSVDGDADENGVRRRVAVAGVGTGAAPSTTGRQCEQGGGGRRLGVASRGSRQAAPYQ